ncbi:hypothetical protein ACJMK2_036594 [Sinanodonta woodiana]|uniref:Uncharacterized protein n=1 Tax=Sinanodonta woodiana TaxID=1069815 RepID=A0ABD3WHP7_SINWO
MQIQDLTVSDETCSMLSHCPSFLTPLSESSASFGMPTDMKVDFNGKGKVHASEVEQNTELMSVKDVRRIENLAISLNFKGQQVMIRLKFQMQFKIHWKIRRTNLPFSPNIVNLFSKSFNEIHFWKLWFYRIFQFSKQYRFLY